MILGTLTAASLAMGAQAAAPMRAPGLVGTRLAPKGAVKLGDSKYDNADGHDLREVRTEGELRVLVLLVEFPDARFSVSDDPRKLIDDMLNQPGFSQADATGSVRDYYEAVSFGQFHPVFDVHGPIMMDRPEVDYVKVSETVIDPETGREKDVYPAGRMIEEAVRKIDSEVNFADYDTNGDGVADFVYVFFAGRGATTGGDVNTTIWPHAYTLTSALGAPVELDGVKVDRYATSAEKGSNNRLSGIGTFCHEFGHVLGLPDLYDTSNNGTASKCFTPGAYSCMDAGNYNNGEHTPPVFSAYERYALEWMCPVTLTGGGEVTLLPVEADNFAYKIPSLSNPKEYFLFENRGGLRYDAHLPARGLAVWHIDFNESVWAENRPNNVANHQRIDLVEADGDLTESSRAGDLFPGSAGVCEYEASLTPSFLSWDNRSTGFGIADMRLHPDGALTMTVKADDGREMEGLALPAPEPKVKGAGEDHVLLQWPAVDGADVYRLSIYELSSLDGSSIGKFADGWWMADITADVAQSDGVCTFKADGLKKDTWYGVNVYAQSPLNSSRSEDGLAFHTHGAPLEHDAPGMYVAGAEEGVVLSWDTLEGADKYEWEVGVLLGCENAQTFKTTFDGSELPEGWEGNGTYDSRAAYCVEAPSYVFPSAGSWLQTFPASNDAFNIIEEVSFWARQRYSDARGILDFYSVLPSGELRHVGRMDDFTNKGDYYAIAFPEIVTTLRMVYTPLSTGLSLYIDDVRIREVGKSALYDMMRGETADTSVFVDVRQQGYDYTWTFATHVRAAKDGVTGPWSEVVEFVQADLQTSGIQGVESVEEIAFAVSDGVLIPSDPDAAYSLYSADGRTVAVGARGAMPLPGRGVYVAVTGAGARRVIW